MVYFVKLSAKAFVEQTRQIEADSEEEARQFAMKTYNDHEWDYDGLDDTQIESEVVRL